MGTGDGRFYGFVTNIFIDEEQTKLLQDQYEVYVDHDFVGRKTLFNQVDMLSDIDDFLKANGIDSFQTKLEGDHYKINPQGQSENIISALEVYFKNR
ncbi:hypothetical protein [Bacillus sp. SG-1]|uniref:hypothetical protein n=1 Tax=Bacillus sp. SG-1 TaxID=161544 RepID=UPI0001543F63|nr:hypothetical protein [Bacillus sp. SG-1]EDL66772.1 hypothetical protein BSG1_05430 [Bacillus sp. SG-1]